MDLKEGQDKFNFMEVYGSNQNEIQKVLIIMDKKYSEKAESKKRWSWHRNPNHKS